MKQSFKHLLAVSMLLVLISACTETTKNASQNTAIIEKYIAAVEATDYGAMEILLAEDYKGYGPSHLDSTNREMALIQWKENINNLYESISYKKSVIAPFIIAEGPNKGEWVANWAELVIKYKNENKPITIWANTNYQIKNGKIIKSLTIYNEADALRQLDYLFIHANELD